MESQQILHEGLQALTTRPIHRLKMNVNSYEMSKNKINKEWAKKMTLEMERHQKDASKSVRFGKSKHENVKDWKELHNSANKDDVANRMSNLENNLRAT